MAAMARPATAQETEIQFLSGHGMDDAVPWKFLCTSGAQSGYWTNLPVPSCWELHGFGTIHYHRDLTNAYNERGLYERDFSVPANWAGRRIFLVFDGAMTDTSAKLNGQPVGPKRIRAPTIVSNMKSPRWSNSARRTGWKSPWPSIPATPR